MPFYVSFGQVHTHRIGGKIIDKDCLYKIDVDKFDEAAKQAENLFGEKWAWIYNEEEKDKYLTYFPRGIVN